MMMLNVLFSKNIFLFNVFYKRSQTNFRGRNITINLENTKKTKTNSIKAEKIQNILSLSRIFF